MSVVSTLQSNSVAVLSGSTVFSRGPTVPVSSIEVGGFTGAFLYWDGAYPGGGAYRPIPEDNIKWVSGTETILFGSGTTIHAYTIRVDNNGWLYFGNPTVNGTRRIGNTGDQLVIEQRVAGNWQVVSVLVD